MGKMPVSDNTIESRLALVQRKIDALRRTREEGKGVRLIVVSKNRPVDLIQQVYRAGVRQLGENRIQELSEKAPRLESDIEWHFIGHLQRNKVRDAVRWATWIHSVDSLRLLRLIERIAGEENRTPGILLQVNITGESSKSGIAPAECVKLAAAAGKCRNLQCLGLMTMAPFEADESRQREVFAGLRKLRDQVEHSLKIDLPELSMGMSNDYQMAIREGATMVRIGSAIFKA